MTDVQPELHNPTGCPVVDYADLNVPTAPAGWHFDNFDAKREEAPIHTGEGGGQQYFLLTRMEDIRKAYQSTDVFSNSAVTVADPNPAYRWIPGDARRPPPHGLAPDADAAVVARLHRQDEADAAAALRRGPRRGRTAR